MTHGGDMGKEGVQLFVGVKDADLGKIIGRLDRPDFLTPRLRVEGFGTAIRRYRCIVRPIRGHYHLRCQFQYRIRAGSGGWQGARPRTPSTARGQAARTYGTR
jgi:hypothetical protein